MKKNQLQYFLYSFSLLYLLTFYSCTPTSTSQDWQLIYRHNGKGQMLAGNKADLIAAVRLGYPIRVGFGGRRKEEPYRSVEHVAEAQFLTVANSKEVFAQITPIYGQRPTLDSDTLMIKFREENKWTIIIGSNGECSTLSRYFDGREEKGRQRQRGATWYAKVPSNIDLEAKALWD